MKRLKKNESKKKKEKPKKTLEERMAFLEKAHKKRVKFESLLALYKYIKDIYGKFTLSDEKFAEMEKEIYDLKLRYGELARRIKKNRTLD